MSFAVNVPVVFQPFLLVGNLLMPLVDRFSPDCNHAEMSTSPFSVIRPDQPNLRSDPPITNKILTRPDPTRSDQLMMTPEAELSKCSIDISVLFNLGLYSTVYSYMNMTYARSMQSEQQNKTTNVFYIFFYFINKRNFKKQIKVHFQSSSRPAVDPRWTSLMIATSVASFCSALKSCKQPNATPSRRQLHMIAHSRCGIICAQLTRLLLMLAFCFS